MKNTFREILEDSGPPMTDRESVIGTAKRALYRRRVAQATGGTVLAVALAVSVPFLFGGGTGGPATGGQQVAAPSTGQPSPSPSPSCPPSGPPRGAPSGPPNGAPPSAPDAKAPPCPPGSSSGESDHARQMLATLIAAVPPGYTTPDKDTVPDEKREGGKIQVKGTQTVKDMPPGSKQTHYVASTEVYRDGKGGSISVDVTVGTGPAPTGDLCAAEILQQGQSAGCRVIHASNGAAVRLSWKDYVPGKQYTAAYFYDNVEVKILENVTVLGDRMPQLTERIFTEQQLADLVIKPQFKP